MAHPVIKPQALVSGDRGFLGRHFAAELTRRGYEVHGLDVKASPAQDCRKFFGFELRHPTVRKHWDLVVHCAAVVGGRETIENDSLATAESLSIDAEMFRWAAAVRPGRVLYISSSAAYPVELQRMDIYTHPWTLKEDDVRLTENIGAPDEVYGWSKVTGELLADQLRRSGVPVTVVRPFSGYGTDQDPSYPFRAILDRVKAGDDPVEVWCGDCVRDWIHVDDLVAGALAVAESGTEDPVNLCTGRATSFMDLVTLMGRAVGRPPIQVRFRPDAPQGVAYRVGDPSRMVTYYRPRITLEEGIRRALES